AQALGQRLERVDRRAVDRCLAGFAQAAVADADAETFEQALERGRPAIHRGRLDHLGGEQLPASGSRSTGTGRHLGPRRYNARPEAATIPGDPLIPAIRQHERAIALRAEGRFALAESACRRAIDGYEAVEGLRHADVANA